MQTLLVEFFNTAVHQVRGLRAFFVRYEDVVLRPRRLSDMHFQMLVFFIGNQ